MLHFQRISLILILCSTAIAKAADAPVFNIIPESIITPEQRALIEQAIPTEAIVPPKKERRLLIYDVNVDHGGHPAIAYANLAFTLMGQKTGAFDVVISRDPQVFQQESLQHFDAIFFNSTVGNSFTDPQLRQNIEEFVRSGGGIMGVHGTTAGFENWSGPRAGTDDWPEFGVMIGGRGAAHREHDEIVFIRVEDPDHPLSQFFPKEGFYYQDEFFRVRYPYSRHRQRVLLSIHNERSNLDRAPFTGVREREDEDYALAWVKSYGEGRSFYSTIGHSPKVFWDPMILRFYLAATQFVLGDLEASTLPSAYVNAKTWEALTDTTFAKGFVLTGPRHASPLRVETFGQYDTTPQWRMPQWNSRGLLDRVEICNDTVAMTDDFKSVTLHRKTGAINLTLDTLNEYETPRTSGMQPWVHLLLEQSPFREPIKVSDAAAIWVEVEFELTQFVDHGSNDPGLHAAQLQWFLYLKNTNPESAGLRDFLWFGLGMFDSRHDFVPDYAAQDFGVDNGSTNFIRTLGTHRFFDEPVRVGERQTIRYNIVDAIQEAIDIAHQNGYIVNTTIDDVVINGTNIGWEVPGTYHVGATLHKMSVTVVKK